jgi:hypothetical protein
MPSIVRTWKTIKGAEYEWVYGQRDNLPAGSDLYRESHLGPSNLEFHILEMSNVSVREVRPRTPWKVAIARAEDATTDVSIDRWKITMPEAEIGFIFQDGESPPFNTTIWTLARHNVLYNIIDSSPYNGDFETILNNNTIKFLIRCNEVQRRFSGGVFLGELRETLKMIIRPAKAIRNALHGHVLDTRRRLSRLSGGEYRNGSWVGDISSTRRAKDIISNGWLQFKFGIQPLVNDLDDGMRATAEYFNYVPRERVSFTSNGESSVSVDGPLDGFGSLRYRIRSKRTSSIRVTTRGAIKMDGPDSTNPAFVRHFGLTWQDAVLTGWEIIPYSFVVDYFANVGEFLEASMFPIAKLAWCNRTKRTTHETFREILRDSLATTLVPISDPRITVVWEGQPTLLYQRRIIERERSPVLVPQLTLRVPGLGSLKWLNLAALFAARL